MAAHFTQAKIKLIAKMFSHYYKLKVCGMTRDSTTIWCLGAFFHILLQIYVPFYVKKKKMIILCAFGNLNVLKD